MKNSKRAIIWIAISFVFLGALTIVAWLNIHSPAASRFDGNRAYQDVVTQVDFGPRVPGTPAHQAEVNWLVSQLTSLGWFTEVQTINNESIQILNVIAKRGKGFPWIILGAHYDSRQYADQDPNLGNRLKPVPGVNDGASGVAVLLELARILPKYPSYQIWLVFFDWEDQGKINNQQWILGSRAFVDTLTQNPDAAVIIDMIGDKNLDIYLERNSDPTLSTEIWGIAKDLGYQSTFINQDKYSMLDDHTPFLEKGIKAIDIIDFDYPYWHTTSDTADKVSAQSLSIVGNTLLKWLQSK
jgi:Zn-dependent M28 family amino/carboxypeptidase